MQLFRNLYNPLSIYTFMPHQCVHCGKIYPDTSKELIEGCSCGSRFFFYIKEEQLASLKEKKIELESVDKKRVEEEVREIIGLDESSTEPVILDLESIRVVHPGKFELDVVNLFSKKRPLIYKLEEGKYIIDLATTFKADLENFRK